MLNRTEAALVAALAGGTLFTFTAAAGQPPVPFVGAGIRLDPARIASIKLVNGQISMTSEWMPYSGFSGRSVPGGCMFDCFGRDWTLGASGAPIGTGVCGSPYFFGASHHNFHWQDDLLKHRNGLVNEFNWAWYNGGETADMWVFLFIGDGDVASCTPMMNGTGVIFTYSNVPTGGYYFSNIDLTGMEIPLSEHETSYEVLLADDATFHVVPATGPVQPMLWAAPANFLAAGHSAAVTPGSYGDQTDKSFDDNVLPDGVFDPLTECYSYDITGAGACSNVLGKMVGFGGQYAPCPSGGSTKRVYSIAGTANNTNWSWTIQSQANDYLFADCGTRGVTAGLDACALASRFAQSLLSSATNCPIGSGSIKAQVTPVGGACGGVGLTSALLTITVAGGPFDLYVGPAGACDPAAQCAVTPALCTFNPQIKLICPSDFNADGFVAGDDFDGYVTGFEAGDASADFNGDGFTTGDDFDEFVAAFEAGC